LTISFVSSVFSFKLLRCFIAWYVSIWDLFSSFSHSLCCCVRSSLAYFYFAKWLEIICLDCLSVVKSQVASKSTTAFLCTLILL
jgi:hypothetical protein